MSVLRTAVAGASRSSAALRTASAPLRHFSTSKVHLKDPQLGDYPELPFVSRQQRKYSPKWWDPQEKSNFGETVSNPCPTLRICIPTLGCRDQIANLDVNGILFISTAPRAR